MRHGRAALAASEVGWNVDGSDTAQLPERWLQGVGRSTAMISTFRARAQIATVLAGLAAVPTSCGSVSDVDPDRSDIGDVACNSNACPVASLALSNPTASTMVVAWTAPSDQSRGAVLNYDIGWTEGDTGRSWDGTFELKSNPLTLTGLIAGTSYAVRVTPITAKGNGPTATTVGSTTGAVAPACNSNGCPVASLTLSNPTTSTMVVAWAAPSDQSRGAVIHYGVGWTEGGTGRSWDGTFALDDSPLTLTGLIAGTSYAVRVTPITAAGAAPVTTKTGSTLGATSSAPNAKLVAGYWQMWEGPHVSEVTASAPQYNLEYAAFAMGNRSGSGSVSFDPVFSTPQRLKTDIAESKAHGVTWLLSVGGGSDSTTQLLNETNATEMVNSLIPIIDNYGFQGVDLDLEHGDGQWVPSAMTSVATKLKAHYGAGFLISAAPRPFEDAYRTFAVQAGAALDLFGYQFYDFPEASNATQLRGIIDQRIDEAVRLGIPASKLMVGCITYSAYENGHNTVQVYRDIFKEVEARYPSLRGVYIWELSLDKRENWNFARVMGQSIRGLL